MTGDLTLKEFELAIRCTHKSQCMPHSWCSIVCCLNFSSLDMFFRCHFSSSLWRCQMFCCWSLIPNFVSLSAQFRDEARYSCEFINFSACLRSASDSSLGVMYFSSLSAEVHAFLRLDVVKLFVHRAAHTEIRTFILVAIEGHGNIQYFAMKCCADVLPSLTLESIQVA